MSGAAVPPQPPADARRREVRGLAFLGIATDDADRRDGDREITAAGAAVRTVVVTSREDLVLVRETREVRGH